MGLQCGIVGVTNTGKTTLFNCISRTKAVASEYAFSTNKSNLGVVDVPDERLYKIDAIIRSERVMPTTIEVVDIPGLAKGSSQGEGVGNQFLADIRNTDALIHVLRCFDSDKLAHIDGSVDPVRDKENIEFELQVKDLESVEKRVAKFEKLIKAGDKDAQKGLEVVMAYKGHLENLQSARTLEMPETDQKYIQDLCLLTMKPVIYVCNVDEQSALTGNAYVEAVRQAVKDENTEVLVVAAALEADIAELEDPDDRRAFMEDAGLTEPGVNKVVQSAFRLLNLQPFFTAGPKEVRAWTIKVGMTAPQAAGVIHSDLERGFIKAEVMSYGDFVKYGSEQACKVAGRLRIEGKSYVVQDGDIMHIRFNV